MAMVSISINSDSWNSWAKYTLDSPTFRHWWMKYTIQKCTVHFILESIPFPNSTCGPTLSLLHENCFEKYHIGFIAYWRSVQNPTSYLISRLILSLSDSVNVGMDKPCSKIPICLPILCWSKYVRPLSPTLSVIKLGRTLIYMVIMILGIKLKHVYGYREHTGFGDGISRSFYWWEFSLHCYHFLHVYFFHCYDNPLIVRWWKIETTPHPNKENIISPFVIKVS